MQRLHTNVFVLLSEYLRGDINDEFEVRFTDFSTSNRATGVTRSRYDALLQRLSSYPVARHGMVIDEYYGNMRIRTSGETKRYVVKTSTGHYTMPSIAAEFALSREQKVEPQQPQGTPTRRSKISRSYYLLDGAFRLDLSSAIRIDANSGILQEKTYEVELEAVRGVIISGTQLQDAVTLVLQLLYGTDIPYDRETLHNMSKQVNSWLEGEERFPFDQSVLYAPRELKLADLAVGGLTPNPYDTHYELDSKVFHRYTEKTSFAAKKSPWETATITDNNTMALTLSGENKTVYQNSLIGVGSPPEVGNLLTKRDMARVVATQYEVQGVPEAPLPGGRWYTGALSYRCAVLPRGEKRLLVFAPSGIWLLGREANRVMDSGSLRLADWDGTIIEGIEVTPEGRRLTASPAKRWFVATDVLMFRGTHLLQLAFRYRLLKCHLLLAEGWRQMIEPLLEINVANYIPFVAPHEFFVVMQEHFERESTLPYVVGAYSFRADEVPYYMSARRPDRVDRKRDDERVLNHFPDHCMWHPDAPIELRLRFNPFGDIIAALSEEGTNFAGAASMRLATNVAPRQDGIFQLEQRNDTGEWLATRLRDKQRSNSSAFVREMLQRSVTSNMLSGHGFDLLSATHQAARARAYAAGGEGPTLVLGANTSDAVEWINRDIVIALPRSELPREDLQSAYDRAALFFEPPDKARLRATRGSFKIITVDPLKLSASVGKKRFAHVILFLVNEFVPLSDVSAFSASVAEVLDDGGTVSTISLDTYAVNELFDPYFGNGYPLRRIDFAHGARVVSLEVEHGAGEHGALLMSGVPSLDPSEWSQKDTQTTLRSALVPGDVWRAAFATYELEIHSERNITNEFLPEQHSWLSSLYLETLWTPLGTPLLPPLQNEVALLSTKGNIGKVEVSDSRIVEDSVNENIYSYTPAWFAGLYSERGHWVRLLRLQTHTGSFVESVLKAANLSRLYAGLDQVDIEVLVDELARRKVLVLVDEAAILKPLSLVSQPTHLLLLSKRNDQYDVIAMEDGETIYTCFQIQSSFGKILLQVSSISV